MIVHLDTKVGYKITIFQRINELFIFQMIYWESKHLKNLLFLDIPIRKNGQNCHSTLFTFDS